MKHSNRMLTIALTLTLLPAAWAGASVKAQLLQPVVEIEQDGGLPAMSQYSGPLLVRYRVSVHNPSLEPITLKQLELRAVEPVSSYQFSREARPYSVTIAPDSTATVTYTVLATARGGMVGSLAPVNLAGVARFQSPVGGFSVPLIATIGPKSSRTAN
ncbi:MAG: hypothetical protein NDJ92_20895 [Thermoanaerobaculia bacterium]|nr:hypothetical protein [Thermoanaerobaculia bacterium]